MRAPLFPFDRIPRPLRLAIFALACVILLYITLAPGEDVPGVSLLWDKAEHAVSWAVLTGAGLLLSTRRRWAIPLFAVLFGAAVEVGQAIMPLGRDGDWRDLLADSLGVVTAWFAWRLMVRLGCVR